jgi:hypothetical protein
VDAIGVRERPALRLVLAQVFGRHRQWRPALVCARTGSGRRRRCMMGNDSALCREATLERGSSAKDLHPRSIFWPMPQHTPGGYAVCQQPTEDRSKDHD